MTGDSADVAAIRETLEDYAITCNAGDFEGWMALWAERGVQMPDNAPSRVGRARIREGMQPAFDAMDMSIAIDDVQELQVWGTHGMTRCTYSLALTPKAGGETVYAMRDGKALTLYEKQRDGAWKIVYDCFNSNIEPGVA